MEQAGQLNEPLLLTRNFTHSNSRWNRNNVLIIFLFALAACLAFYLYLNIQVYKNVEDYQAFKPLSRRKPILDHESIFENSGPSLISINDLLAHCIVALKTAGHEVVENSLIKKPKLKFVGSKGKTREGVDDIVTGIDIKSNKIITGIIKDSYKRLRIISEEDKNTQDFASGSANLLPINRTEFANLLKITKHEIDDNQQLRNNLLPQDKLLVWIDPLDATKEYSENLTEYVTLMGCIVYNQRPIAGIIHKPFINRTYWSLLDESNRKLKLSPDLLELISITDVEPQKEKINLSLIVSRSHAGDVEEAVRGINGGKINILTAGGSGYKSIELIKGSVDAYIHKTHIKNWDICAPNSLLNSLGGIMTTFEGNIIEFGNPQDFVVTDGLVAAMKFDIHEKLMRHLKKSH